MALEGALQSGRNTAEASPHHAPDVLAHGQYNSFLTAFLTPFLTATQEHLISPRQFRCFQRWVSFLA